MSFSSDQSRWFAEEIKPHERVLRGYLHRRFPTLRDQDDVVQEAYSRVFRAWREGQLASAKSFLFTVARNVAIDIIRRQKIVEQPISEIDETALLERAASLHESVDHRQRRAMLVNAIASMPQRCREVFTLRYVEGMAYKEIAEQLGISANTVRLHLIKGTRHCIAFFRAEGLLESIDEEPPEIRSET